jgi:predicted esterase
MTDEDGVSRRDALRAGAAAGVGMAIGTGSAAGERSPTVRSCEPTDRDGSPAPGPEVLYEDPITAPQFENGAGWTADPLLVSGAQAYDSGEFLYQDWAYDDYGANTDPTDTSTQPPTSTTLANPVGDVLYPTDDARYRDNAADLLEFRCRTQGNQVIYRITLNTIVDSHPDAPIVAIGIDTGGDGFDTWGSGIGTLGDLSLDRVVTAGHDGTEANAAVKGGDESATASVDVDRNQIEITVPLAPATETWTHYCVSGVHDGDGGFAQVQNQASATNPGGANGSDPPPVFNVAFCDEPIGSPHHWRDKAQADALAARDISAFGAEIDFDRLRRNVTSREQADPEQLSGYVNRLFSSRISIDGQRSYAPGEEGVEDDGEDAVLTGRVQPYSVYIPESYDPDDPGPLHVLPHSLGQSYNQYAGTPNLLRQLGEQRDALVLMFEGRGPAGWWHDEAEFDLFEAWADFRTRYEYDPDRVTLGGYSMGGYATYRLASLYPDLFARGFEIVGPPDEDIFGGPTDGERESVHNTLDVTDNLRHFPLLMWHGTNDELVPLPGPVNYARDLREHGYRHRFEAFPGYDHFLFSVRDQWGPGREFLDGATVTRNPERVTYRSKPVMGYDLTGVDGTQYTESYDSAYWLSDIEVVAPESDDGGLVDAISYGTGYGEPVAENFSGSGTEPDPHVERGTRWKESLDVEGPRNALELDLSGVSALTVWVEEAGLDPSQEIELSVDSDEAVTVRFATESGARPVDVPPGEHTVSVAPCASDDSGSPRDGRPSPPEGRPSPPGVFPSTALR